ncbi:MAG TPA: hypothetical protein DCW47_06530 [Lachnospiraceae bacterium]|nr:hypothetical protein [Lachnospiraceae bacterium]HAV00833.1 hypothetical protein [Lachnospiraceae bacterium]
MDSDNKKRGFSDKSVMTIRLLVGCYLLYIDHSVVGNLGNYEGAQKIILIACLLLFLVVGILLIFISVRFLWNDWKQSREQIKEEERERESSVVNRSITENASILKDAENTEETEEKTEEVTGQ